MLQKKDMQADSSRASDNIQNNNSTFITNSNGSLLANKYPQISQNPSFRRNNLPLVKARQQSDNMNNQIIKVEIQSSGNQRMLKQQQDQSSITKQKLHQNQSEGNILHQNGNIQFARLQKGDISQNNQNGNSKVEFFNGPVEEYKLHGNIQQLNSKHKNFPQISLSTKNQLNNRMKSQTLAQTQTRLNEINKTRHLPNIKRNQNDKILGVLSPLKNSFSDRQLRRAEASPVFMKNRRMATFKTKKVQKVFYLQDTFQKVQELYDAEKYKQQSTNSVIKEDIIQTATRILDTQSSRSSDQLSHYEQKHKQKQVTTDQEIVDPSQSIFFQKLRTGNLQSLVHQPILNMGKQKNKQRKVNLHQVKVQYNPVKIKDFSRPIQLNTFDEIQNTVNGKSKKYLVNTYKANKFGLQRKVTDQADNFFEQLNHVYSEYYRQKALDESDYTKRDEHSFSKISSMNKINTLNQINDVDLDNSAIALARKKRIQYSNNNYERPPPTQEEISELDEVHLEYVSLLDSDLDNVQRSNQYKSKKKVEDKLFKLISAYQQIETEPDKQKPEKEQPVLNLKRNKLENSWPHKEQNLGDNSFHSFTEAQLDTYYNHSQSIQKTLLADPNLQKSIKNLLKLEYFFKQIQLGIDPFLINQHPKFQSLCQAIQ